MTLFALLAASTLFTACSNDSDGAIQIPDPQNRYEGGVYLINEGQLGIDQGSINYYWPSKDSLATYIFREQNNDQKLGVTSQSAQSFLNTLYVVSKQGNNRRLVAIDQLTFKEMADLSGLKSSLMSNSFCGITPELGILTTTDGAYRIDLSTLTAGEMLEGSAGNCGSMLLAGNYLFINCGSNGVRVFDKSKNMEQVVATLPSVNLAFTQTKDGTVWAGKAGSFWTGSPSQLIKINPTTLDYTTIDLPTGNSFHAPSAYCHSPLTASTLRNELFFAQFNGGYGGGSQIYRVDAATGAISLFAEAGSSDHFYGQAIYCQPLTGDLVVNYLEDTFGAMAANNKVVVFDGTTGFEKKRREYTGYFFPGAILQ